MADPEEMMTIEDLAEVYRVEKKSGSLMNVRSDFYSAVARLLKTQRQECDRLLAKDPDSLLCEGAKTRRRKGQQLSKEIIEMRMHKICNMALRGAMGAENCIEALTSEERQYYENILTISTNHKSILSRLSGSMTYRNKTLTEPVQVPAPEPVAVPEAAPAELQEEEYYEPEDDVPIPAPEPSPAIQTAEVPLDIVPEEGIIPLDEEMEESVPEADIPEDELDRMPPMEEKNAPAPIPAEVDESEFIMVRILQDIGTVAGPVKNYNLTKESVVRMPTLFAQVLINRGMAAKISMSP